MEFDPFKNPRPVTDLAAIVFKMLSLILISFLFSTLQTDGRNRAVDWMYLFRLMTRSAIEGTRSLSFEILHLLLSYSSAGVSFNHYYLWHQCHPCWRWRMSRWKLPVLYVVSWITSKKTSFALVLVHGWLNGPDRYIHTYSRRSSSLVESPIPLTSRQAIKQIRPMMTKSSPLDVFIFRELPTVTELAMYQRDRKSVV